MALDPNSAVAYYARGNFQSLVTGDWTAALSDLERAVALDPGGEVGAYAQSVIVRIKATVNGRIRDEIDWYRRLLERNPLDTTILFELVRALQAADQLDESAATSRKLLQLNPAFAGAQAQYGLTLLLMEERRRHWQKRSMNLMMQAGWRLWPASTRAWADGLSPTRLCVISSGALPIGMISRLQQYMPTAVGRTPHLHGSTGPMCKKKSSLIHLKLNPLFRELHGDPRFDALLRKVKLVE